MNIPSTYKHILSICAALTGLLLAGAVYAWTVTADPVVAPPTGQVTVKGSHFPAGSWVEVFLKYKRCSLNTDSSGNFACTFKVPKTTTPGSQPVWTVSRATGQWFKTPFTVRMDWPQFGFDAQHTSYNRYENMLSPVNASKLGLVWQLSTGAYVGDAPIVADGKLYITLDDLSSNIRNQLRALDAADGQPLWTRSFDYISASPVADRQVLYLHGEEHSKWLLYAIDAGSGDLRWKQYGHGPAFSPPAVVDGVVFSARQQELTAYRASNGRRLWNQTTADMLFTSPAVSSGVVMVGGYWHGLYAYRAKDGSPLWNQDLVGGINSTPVVANGLVYAGSGGTLFAFKVEDGTPIWRRDTGYYVAPGAVANGVLYVAEAAADKPGWHDVVHALRAADGKQLWRRSFAGGDSSSIFPGLAVANGVVYVGSWTGHLYALDAADGSVLKTLATGRVTLPTIANGLVYVGTWESDGQVQAFGLSDAPHP